MNHRSFQFLNMCPVVHTAQTQQAHTSVSQSGMCRTPARAARSGAEAHPASSGDPASSRRRGQPSWSCEEKWPAERPSLLFTLHTVGGRELYHETLLCVRGVNICVTARISCRIQVANACNGNGGARHCCCTAEGRHRECAPHDPCPREGTLTALQLARAAGRPSCRWQDSAVPDVSVWRAAGTQSQGVQYDMRGGVFREGRHRARH